MKSTREVVRSFNSGEISRLMFGRVADQAFANGVARARNVIVNPTGPVRSRPGFAFVAETPGASKARLIEFAYSADDQVIIEVGAGYLRFHTLGATVLFTEPASTPTYVASFSVADASITAATGEFNLGAAHGLETDDPVYIYKATGTAVPFPLPSFQTLYAIKTGANTFKLSLTKGGAAVTNLTLAGSSTTSVNFDYLPGDVVTYSGGIYQCLRRFPGGYAPGAAGGLLWQQQREGDVYEIPNYYLEDDLSDITVATRLDSVTLCHRNYPPHEIKRISSSVWTFTPVDFEPQIIAPSGVAAVAEIGNYYNFTWASGAINKLVDLSVTNCAKLGFGTGAKVFLESTDTYSSGSVSLNPIAGEFVVEEGAPSAAPGAFTIATADGGHVLNNAGFTASGPGPRRVRLILDLAKDQTHYYKVTAEDADGVESQPSDEVSVDNHLQVDGSYNTITWNSVGDAKRYHVYRKINGVFGRIGSVDADQELTFKDDNVDPDLDVLLRTQDDSLVSLVFSINAGTAISGSTITSASHGILDGYRVQVLTTDALPTNLVAGTPYYAVNCTQDTFQLATELGGVAIDLSTGSPSGTAVVFAGDWPGAVGWFEGRRIFGGSLLRGHRVWGSRSGTASDMTFSIPIRDDDRIRFDIDSMVGGRIRHIVSVDQLLLLSTAGEFRITPLNTDSLTPDSIANRPQSYNGSGAARPVNVSNSVLFFAAGGHVRELGYSAAAQGYVTSDLSLRSDHLFDDYDIVDSARSRFPRPIAWAVSSSGALLGLTYVPDERVVAWHLHETDGTIESVAVATEGNEDRVYVVVRRTVDGVTRRFIERMGSQSVGALEDSFNVDCGSTYDGAAATTLRNLNHLDGETVSVLADGIPIEAAITRPAAKACTFNTTTNQVTCVGHGVVDGEDVVFATTDTLPTPIEAGRGYKAIVIDADTLELEFAVDAGAIDLGGSPFGTHTIRASARLVLDEAASVIHVGRPYTATVQTVPLLLHADAALGAGRTKNIAKVWVELDRSAPFYVGAGGDLVPTDPELTAAPALSSERIDVVIEDEWAERSQVTMQQTKPMPMSVVSITIEVATGGG